MTGDYIINTSEMGAILNTDAPKKPSASSPGQSPVSAHRLSLPYPVRIITTTTGAFITGMFLGLSHGAQTAGYRFRAENSYRLPTSSIGWYFYHKSKNYHMMLGGVKEGMKMGPKIAFWSGGYFLFEEAVDRARGRSDFLSSVTAGFSIAGAFSLWSKDASYSKPHSLRIAH